MADPGPALSSEGEAAALPAEYADEIRDLEELWRRAIGEDRPDGGGT